MNLSVLRNTRQRTTAKTFFEHVCPVLFRLRSELCQELGGRYAFTLQGAGGGAWTLDFGALAVESNAKKADLAISMKVDDFESLMDGSLDAGVAIQRGDLAFSGASELFGHLAAFTQPF